MRVGRAIAIESAVVIAAVAVTLFAWLSAKASDGSAERAPWAASHPLGLMARAEQGELIVSWNPGAEAIRTAKRAKLMITDGGQRDEVELDGELLRTRFVAYSPLSRSVAFQLTVENATQGAALTDSVWVVTPQR
jgi:hypothetical protein